MRSINRVALMGYLATDPELRETPNGKHVAIFKIATNRDWKSSDGERHQVVDYHRIVVWGRRGEVCAQHLHKGSGVYVEGRLANHQYTDKDGVERSMSEIVADTVNFITFKKNNDIQEVNVEEVAVGNEAVAAVA